MQSDSEFSDEGAAGFKDAIEGWVQQFGRQVELITRLTDVPHMHGRVVAGAFHRMH